MKVLFVSSGLDPRTGGTASAAVSVCLAARRVGIQCDIAFPMQPGTEDLIGGFVADLARADVGIHRFPFAEGSRAVRWGVSHDLGRWLRANVGDYDLIVAHSMWVLSTIQAIRAAKKVGRPIVAMPHEGLTRFDMGNASSKLLGYAKKALRGYYLRNLDRIILSSDLERRESLLSDNPKAVVVRHPVFDEVSHELIKRLVGPDPEWSPLTVGYIGRLHPKKNIGLLIDALDMSPGVQLVIAGAGGIEEELKERADRRRVTDRVRWAGFVQASDRESFFRSVDIIAMPSVFECFGLVAAEALAAGTPVLLSPTVGVAEDIEAAGAGLIVPPRPDALAAAFRRLHEDRGELARYAGRTQETALRFYSFAAHGQALRKVFEELLIPADPR
ncbi:glycosyltransferase family 4 protein [Lacibacterium aquatile]|uniref:Glycosyltransferase family 4 protein n=1 Tax=Lacibacterium aquatile TaxID=1168082 RepID=A0ABW5DT36_9PROT